MVPELLDTHATTKRLKFMLKKKGLARLAVAYWGEGAIKQLGLDRLPSETWVLCDLFSGCCNPDEIKGLLKAGVRVRYIDKLHAKLYCIPGGTVIGSSNASSNGLGSEGRELSGNVELNTVVNSPAFTKAAEKWFDERWAKAVDQEVDEYLAERARPAWMRRQAHGPRSPTTLLTELAANSDAFRIRPIRILVYHWDEGGSGAGVEREAKPEYSQAQWHRMEKGGTEDWYWDSTGWPVEPGTTFLDFDLARPHGRPRFGGIWKVREPDRAWTIDQNGGRIILCDWMASALGFPLPKVEQSKLSDALKNHLEHHKLWDQDTEAHHYNHLDMPLYEFWKEHADELQV